MRSVSGFHRFDLAAILHVMCHRKDQTTCRRGLPAWRDNIDNIDIAEVISLRALAVTVIVRVKMTTTIHVKSIEMVICLAITCIYIFIHHKS